MSKVAFLRGMNVGGHRITNAALAQHFVDMGFTGVRTFRASGNVLFSGGPADPAEHIQTGLQAALGYAVPTFIRSKQELGETLEGVPWGASVRAEMGKLQITFLAQPLSSKDTLAVLSLASQEDLLAVQDRALYWLPRVGVSTSKLDFASLHRILGPQTTRTEGTCKSILAKLA